MFRHTSIATSLLCIALLGACTDQNRSVFEPSSEVAFSRDGEGSGGSISLLTRNVYIGADIAPVFQVDFSNPVAVVQAAAAVWAAVQSTRFEERAVALVDEIEERRPHLIGLQEVARFVTIDPASGPTGSLDFLSVIDDEIRARGLHYEIVQVQENTRVTLPVAIDFGTGAITEAIDFTDRDVVLARSDVAITSMASDNYQAEFTLGPGVTLKRGWIRVEADHRGQSYTFVNTHLEGQSLAPIQAFQVQELLTSVLADVSGITILAGDLNSDAEAGPGDPSWTPTYDELIAEGFVDTWDQVHPSSRRPGFTCCHDADLLNLRPAFDERIDFVLVRDDRDSFGERVIEAVRAKVLGDEIDDLTSGGLWPSDHGGLFSRIRLAEADDDDHRDRNRGDDDNDNDDDDDDDEDDDDDDEHGDRGDHDDDERDGWDW